LRDEPLDALAEEVARKLTIDVPQLKEDEITVSPPKEVEISVQGYSRAYYGFDGEHKVKGTRVVFCVPFTGDAIMFSVRPSSFTLNPPRADVRSNTLEKTFEGVSLDPTAVKREFGDFLRSVKDNLATQEKDVAQFNSGLKQLVYGHLNERKARLEKADALVEGFGYKVK
ncbi:MAG: hypothetical protein ACREMY_17655, partial [bacterium]